MDVFVWTNTTKSSVLLHAWMVLVLFGWTLLPSSSIVVMLLRAYIFALLESMQLESILNEHVPLSKTSIASCIIYFIHLMFLLVCGVWLIVHGLCLVFNASLGGRFSLFDVTWSSTLFHYLRSTCTFMMV